MSKDFIPLEENFILLMEKNSQFSRENLFLLCLDKVSASVFDKLGITCARVTGIKGHQPIYRIRVKVRYMVALDTRYGKRCTILLFALQGASLLEAPYTSPKIRF